MRKLVLIICMMTLVFTMPSCGYFSNDRDKSEVTTGTDSATQNHSESTVDRATESAIAEALLMSRNMEKEKSINVLRDSIDTISVQLYTARHDIVELKEEVESMKAEKLATNTFFVFLAIFFVVVIVLVCILVKKLGLTETQVERIASRIKPSTTGANSGRSTYNREYFALMTRISRLEQVIKGIQNTGCPKDNGSGNIGTGFDTDNPTTGTKEPKIDSKSDSRVFYMSRPSGDCEFMDKEKRYIASEDTLYRFELKRNKANQATFEFYSKYESGVRESLMMQDLNIERVCDADIQNRDNGKYKCTEKGEAELRGDKWVVTKKAKVMFY